MAHVYNGTGARDDYLTGLGQRQRVRDEHAVGAAAPAWTSSPSRCATGGAWANIASSRYNASIGRRHRGLLVGNCSIAHRRTGFASAPSIKYSAGGVFAGAPPTQTFVRQHHQQHQLQWAHQLSSSARYHLARRPARDALLKVHPQQPPLAAALWQQRDARAARLATTAAAPVARSAPRPTAGQQPSVLARTTTKLTTDSLHDASGGRAVKALIRAPSSGDGRRRRRRSRRPRLGRRGRSPASGFPHGAPACGAPRGAASFPRPAVGGRRRHLRAGAGGRPGHLCGGQAPEQQPSRHGRGTVQAEPVTSASAAASRPRRTRTRRPV